MSKVYEISLDESNLGQFVFGNFTHKTYLSSNVNNNNKIKAFKDISSTKEKEDALVDDLLNVLDTREGKYIKFVQGLDLNDTQTCLNGIDFEIDVDVDIYYKEIATQIALLSKKISSLAYFYRYFNKSCYGSVLSKLCEYIRKFLNQHRLMLCQLRESKISLIMLSQRINNHPFDDSYGTLFQCITHLYDLTRHIVNENYKRLQESNRIDMQFENIMNSLKEDLNSKLLNDIVIDSTNSKYINGGIVLNFLHFEIQQYRGNEKSTRFLKNLYHLISTDYLTILNDWLRYGKIFDEFDEFFISEEKNHTYIYNAYYWINKFAIKRESLLSQFKSGEFQKKIFLTGKYLAILNECECSNLVRNSPYESIVSLNSITLESQIDKAYKRSNELFVGVFLNNYQLPGFLHQLNKYFLLTDASYFNNFLNVSNHDLKRSFNANLMPEIKKKYLLSYKNESNDITDTIISQLLNVKFETKPILDDILEIVKTHAADSNKILNASNLGSLTELLEENAKMNSNMISSNESELKRCNRLTVSHFNIELEIPFPLNQLIIDSQKLEYQLIFRHSTFLKFLEKRFEKSWREIGYHTFWTWGFEDRKVSKWIRKCRYSHSKMFDFLKIYSYHLKEDVLESNWANVESTLKGGLENNKKFDFIDFKSQLTEFLSSSLSDMLLSQIDVANCLYEIFSLIFMFHEYVLSLRKNLLLIDEGLLDLHRERLNLSFSYSHDDKGKRFGDMTQILLSYDEMFSHKLRELCGYLSYYGEIDSPKMLLLHNKLVTSFNIQS